MYVSGGLTRTRNSGSLTVSADAINAAEKMPVIPIGDIKLTKFGVSRKGTGSGDMIAPLLLNCTP